MTICYVELKIFRKNLGGFSSNYTTAYYRLHKHRIATKFIFFALIFRKPASKFASVFDRQNFHEVSVLGDEQFKCSGKNLTIRACETAIRLSYRRVRISLWSSCFSFFRAAFCSAPLHKNQAFRASAFAPFPRCARERLPRHSNPCRKIRQVHSY